MFRTLKWPALALVTVVAACGPDGQSPTSTAMPDFALVTPSEANPVTVYVCKIDWYTFKTDAGVTPELFGTDEVFHFDISVGGGLVASPDLKAGDWSALDISAYTSGFVAPYCTSISATDPMVTITEKLEADQGLKKVTVYNSYEGIVNSGDIGTIFDAAGYAQTVENTDEETLATAGTNQSISLNLTNTYSWVVWFKNVKVDAPPPPPGGGDEGCTPGYWGRPQHLDSWDDTPYSPTDDATDTFGVSTELAGTMYESWTLLDAVNQKGGGNTPGQLLRHATAALLNASNPDVDYPYTVDQIIEMVQDAIDSGEYEDTKDVFDAANNLGCTLS